MKPPRFQYVVPATVERAIELYGAHGDGAQLIAGGQSLVPMLNFRLSRPEVLIDISRIEALAFTDHQGSELRIGAATRQRSLELATPTLPSCRALREALRHVGHVQTRNRGTVGGSIAHADPAAEIPAVLLALEGSVRVTTSLGDQWIDAEDLFIGPYETSIPRPGIITEIRIPTPPDALTGFAEVAPRMGDFATCAVAASVRLDPDSRSVAHVALAAAGVHSTPVRLRSAEALLLGEDLTPSAIAAAAAASNDDVDPLPDLHSDVGFRRRLLVSLVQRVLEGLT